jgi:hypothetical protein
MAQVGRTLSERSFFHIVTSSLQRSRCSNRSPRLSACKGSVDSMEGVLLCRPIKGHGRLPVPIEHGRGLLHINGGFGSRPEPVFVVIVKLAPGLARLVVPERCREEIGAPTETLNDAHFYSTRRHGVDDHSWAAEVNHASSDCYCKRYQDGGC